MSSRAATEARSKDSLAEQGRTRPDTTGVLSQVFVLSLFPTKEVDLR